MKSIMNLIGAFLALIGSWVAVILALGVFIGCLLLSVNIGVVIANWLSNGFGIPSIF